VASATLDHAGLGWPKPPNSPWGWFDHPPRAKQNLKFFFLENGFGPWAFGHPQPSNEGLKVFFFKKNGFGPWGWLWPPPTIQWGWLWPPPWPLGVDQPPPQGLNPISKKNFKFFLALGRGGGGVEPPPRAIGWLRPPQTTVVLYTWVASHPFYLLFFFNFFINFSYFHFYFKLFENNKKKI
jgi:hypothetical protein